LDTFFRSIFSASNRTIIVLFFILLGGFSRFFGLNYDSGHRVHPDERFLSMVLSSQVLPETVLGYFDTAKSTLNPVNVGHTFYVYGTFPLWVFQGVGWLFGFQGYDSNFLAQRGVSAAFDLGLIFLIFGFVSNWLGKSVGTVSALLYMLCPVAIQQAHFGAVDSMTTFYCFLSFALMVQFRDSRKFIYRSFWMGLAVGAAMACKLSAVFWFAFYFLILFWRFFQRRILWKEDVQAAIIFCLSAIFIFRVLQPYAFAGPGFFNFTLSETFLNNVRQQFVLAKPSLYYPPAVQWFERSIFYSAEQLWTWGVGLWFLLPFCFSIYLIASKKIKGTAFEVLIFVIAGTFIHGIWQSLEPNKYIRYQLPIYPLIYILVSVGLVFSYRLLKLSRKVINLFVVSSVILQLIWFASFLSIYSDTDARLKASHWMMQNIPSGAVVTNETSWDMTLPFSVHHLYPGKRFIEKKLEIFEPDSSLKLSRMNEMISQSDYLVMSSLRTWGTLGRLPQYYPQTISFYRSLMNCPEGQSVPECFAKVNSLEDWKDHPESQFKLVYVGTRYPRIGRFFINDTLAEESFTVYDHSKVFIWQKKATLNL